eukprot:m.593724 g.593724  ORF g.593724 m.593724 type:complete len:174 (+) comp22394_c0_seq3:624-1145(+)
MAAQVGRQGIAVLAFEVTQGGVNAVAEKYQQLHPDLVVAPVHEYDSHKIFEVYAYYKGDVRASEADKGTILRFVEQTSNCTEFLPGLSMVADVQFPENARPLYFDHWVSNVVSRTGFLSTLKDTLGFDMKVCREGVKIERTRYPSTANHPGIKQGHHEIHDAGFNGDNRFTLC